MANEEGILELDFNLADAEDFENLPAGEYPASVKAADLRTSDKGNEYYYTVITIDPKDYPADYDVANNPEGTNLIYARLMKPTSDNRRSITSMKKWYKAIGLDANTTSIDPSTWVGLRLKVLLGISQYNGEDRNEIKAIEALDD